MKKVVALLLALALCFALCACGSSNAAPAAAPAADSGAQAAPAAAPAKADGKVYEFVVCTNDAATSMCELYLETLFGTMEEESGGRMTFTYYPGGSLYGPGEAVDAVKNGAADITWTAVSFYPGRFPLAEAASVADGRLSSARVSTDVLWEIYNTVPEMAAEFAGFKIIALASSSPYPISTVGKKIETPADFKGMQIRAGGTVTSMYVNALGATAISMPTNDVYESMEKHVLDGMCNDWHNIDCFKLAECIDYTLNVSVNTGCTAVLMNQDRYNELPDDLKAIVDKYAGKFASDMHAYWWDSCRYWVGDEMKAAGVEIYDPSPELLAFMNSDEVLQGVRDYYVEYVDSYNIIDGATYYAKVNDIIDKCAANHTDDWAKPFNYTDWDMSAAEGYNG